MSSTEAKEAKRQAELHLAGKDSEEARAVVKAQRDLKKKRDALRKVQKKLKADGATAETAAAVREEEAALLKDILQLEKITETTVASLPAKAAPLPATAVASAGSTSNIATVKGLDTKGGPVSSPDADASKEMSEAERATVAKHLRDLVERSMNANRLEKLRVSPCNGVVHPRIAEVAVLMEQMLLVGGSARALALLSAFRELVRATTVLTVPTLNQVNTTAFENIIDINFDFVRRKRAASAGMRYVKEALLRRFVALRDEVIHPEPPMLPLIEELGDPREATLKILDAIEAELTMSFKIIVEDRSLPYVSSSDTILVFGRSSLVEYILLSRSHNTQRKPKRVIVVDSAPLFEGRQLAHKLLSANIEVTYGLLTACCTLMPKCTRVFMGASAVLQNGDVFGRCGTALIAACAKLFRKPVLCFSESYKFLPEVWVGNLAQNTKLADMRPVVDTHGSDTGTHSPAAYSTPPCAFLPQQRASPGWGAPLSGGDFFDRGGGLDPSPFSASASGYLYDLTPASYVDMIICEMGCLHTSAIVAAIKDRENRDASQLLDLVQG